MITTTFESISVIDLSFNSRSSYTSMIFADMGASVLNVQLPKKYKSPLTFQNGLWNRGKKSIVVDYTKPDGLNIINQLVENSDVFISNFNEDKSRKLNLSYESLEALNPMLIYSVSPVLSGDYFLDSESSDEGLLSAYSGIYADEADTDGTPFFVNISLASYSAAWLSAYGIMIALINRQMIGQGQIVEVPWFDAASAIRTHMLIEGEQIEPGPPKQRTHQGANPVYRLFKDKNRDWFFLGCGNSIFWNKLCIALGIEYLTADPKYLNAPWGIDIHDQPNLISTIQNIFKKESKDYWIKLLSQFGIPIGPLMSREEFINHPQVKYNDIILDITNEGMESTLQVANPILVEGVSLSKPSHAPKFGQHTSEVLQSLGYSIKVINELAQSEIIQI